MSETKKKVRVAFFDFADCEGCQLQLTYLNTALLDILNSIDIVNFREVMHERSEDYDVAVIEGSITRPHDEERLKDIRAKAKILVAYGACACTGGINGIMRNHTVKAALETVYPGRKDKLETGLIRAVDQVVKVDAYVHGCPINLNEFAAVLKGLLAGALYKVPDYAVCVECKLKENVCLYEKGQICMGPVTRAGCGAWCTGNGNTCYSCRGLLEDINKQGQLDILQKHGVTVEMLKDKFSLYNGCKLEGNK
ncbi:MAG: cytochrome B [Candidatus Firestonebacteria bacterium RIFOXYC2_FULL_39_67]|nr:MAG: cytochrome B [Candidatus Firestonebacteria bacterium RIFOXYD2_FULL_39_29]OGF54301.1 MAG: cytochrome B [Candidatus Firestonebacteria bacterium RIFOXYC2_FULL_39_67]OGF55554.1 MAG: cytochrome B [Candidatus Firestonebacteria bacterium RifOxyC12_full_39_7]